MAAVTKKSDGNDEMAIEPEENPKPPGAFRKTPPSYPKSIPGPQPTGGKPAGVPPTAPIRGGYFSIYKKGQGYWTRMGTVGTALLIGVLTANFIWDQCIAHLPLLDANARLHLFWTEGHREKIAALIVAIFAAVYGLVAFYYMNKPRNADFLIATDSEMKKVNWTTKKELIGSTRVVILFVIFTGVVLFVYDLFFHTIFYWIGVLKIKPPFFH